MIERRMDSDILIARCFEYLQRDFRSTTGVPFFKWDVTSKSGIRDFRLHDHTVREGFPYHVKCKQQIMGFLKRYRFKDDLYTDSELLELTAKKFVETQQRISVPFEDSELTFRVLQKARHIAREILGPYDLEVHQSLCRFGKRACNGHPFSRSYLHTKLKGPITGSPQHVAWFKKYMQTDEIMSEMISKLPRENGFKRVESLPLSFVPKSYKSLRSIKPNTLLGTFYTLGLGSLVQTRLLEVGLDITKLQMKHRNLAYRSSLNGLLVTADLSAAGDSLTIPLLNKILPRSWFRAVMYGSARYFSINGKDYALQSVLTMGDGFTFPLQTLVFYSLLKAIGELVGRKTFVSVYGDDLIFSRWLYPYVKATFPRLHLILNKEKTYVNSSFRESCGGDYYRGVDVRPYSYEGEHVVLYEHAIDEAIYKLLNGLSAHWRDFEIPRTRAYLLGLLRRNGLVLQVPTSFPDGSGVKFEVPTKHPDFSPVKFCQLRQTYSFEYLRQVSGKIGVDYQLPYYWEKLRTMTNGLDDMYNPSDTPLLLWQKICRKTGKRLRQSSLKPHRLVPETHRKGSSRTLRQHGFADFSSVNPGGGIEGCRR